MPKESNEHSEEVLLGVDFGESRTGLAFGRSGLASPLTTIQSSDPNVVISQIARSVIDNKVSKIIMGLPVTPDGKETPQALVVRKFAKLLRIRLKRPVEFVNESGTSKEAIEFAVKSGMSQKSRKSIDHISAALILKRYYNEHEG